MVELRTFFFDQWEAWDLVMWPVGQWEASKKIAWGGDTQTDRQTDGHRDSMTESAQWADSVKNILCVFLHFTNFNFRAEICSISLYTQGNKLYIWNPSPICIVNYYFVFSRLQGVPQYSKVGWHSQGHLRLKISFLADHFWAKIAKSETMFLS